MARSGQHTALADFFTWESQSWVEIVADLVTDEKTHFMPLSPLRSYFAAANNLKLARILAEVFSTQHPPIDPDLILREHTAVFTILLRIGRGELIEQFAQYEELSDGRLPFDSANPPSEFLEIIEQDEDGGEELKKKFFEKQIMYCVPVFDGHMLHKRFAKQRLLPITNKETKDAEGAVEKYVVTVFGAYNKLIQPGQDPETNNVFVLRRYLSKEVKAAYMQEVNGFRSVKHAESIIRFYGSYIHGDVSNVLLEYADKGSLEVYFKNETPPSRGLDIIKFWENLFQLIKGLKAIHSVREGHHDVKPENVSVVSHGAPTASEWAFKLSTFGVSGTGDNSQPDSTRRSLGQAVSTYAPPEAYLSYQSDGSNGRRSPGKLTWSADIWSLGCIYSEAAMWIADGYKGLEAYRRQRVAESDRILFKAGDCFHDGEKVLSSVTKAHRDIEDRLRRSDYITKDVLDSLVDEMLWEDDRPNAKALSRRAESVLNKARQKLSGDEYPRPGSAQSRSLPPRLPPPTQALPPIPRGSSPGLSSITEQQPPSVERWRSQVSPSARASRIVPNQFGHGSDTASPVLTHLGLGSVRASVVDNSMASSTASWQMGDTMSNSNTSPNTPATSPHVSVQYDYGNQTLPNQFLDHKQPPVRNSRQQSSTEYKIPPKSLQRGLSYGSNRSNNDSAGSDAGSVSPAPPKYPGPNSSYTPTVPDVRSMPTSNPIQYSNVAPPFNTGGGPPIAVVNNDQFPIQSNNNGPNSPISVRPLWQQTTPTYIPMPLPNSIVSPVTPYSPSQVGLSQPVLAPAPIPAPISSPSPMQPSAPVLASMANETRTMSRAPSKASSRNSSAPSASISTARTEAPSYFHTETRQEKRPKSQKRGMGFSLFPTKSTKNPPIPIDPLIQSTNFTNTKMYSQPNDSERRSIRSSISGHSISRSTTVSHPATTLTPDPTNTTDSFEYLSLNTCLEWKRAHKKVKKASKVPPLPGASMLQGLEGRDHAFIIDDSTSMEPYWPDVKRVFEALSYVVKGMSPDGTELFYTVSYDTWRRKDTTDLCDYLEKKATAGVTDISYRLNLQLQSFMAKITMAKGDKKKTAALRPLSFYVLTNGDWGEGSLEKLKGAVRKCAEFLVKEKMEAGMVAIEFISFAQSTGGAAGNLGEIGREDFGLDIVDCTRWTGNVLKMLRGPLDKSLYSTEVGEVNETRGTSVISELA